MKKSHIAAIILLFFLLFLIINLLYHFIYFKNLHSNIRLPTEQEKQKTIEILSKENISEYSQVEFISVYTLNNKKIISIKLTKNNSSKIYLVDLKSERLLRR